MLIYDIDRYDYGAYYNYLLVKIKNFCVVFQVPVYDIQHSLQGTVVILGILF